MNQKKTSIKLSESFAENFFRYLSLLHLPEWYQPYLVHFFDPFDARLNTTILLSTWNRNDLKVKHEQETWPKLEVSQALLPENIFSVEQHIISFTPRCNTLHCASASWSRRPRVTDCSTCLRFDAIRMWLTVHMSTRGYVAGVMSRGIFILVY